MWRRCKLGALSGDLRKVTEQVAESEQAPSGNRARPVFVQVLERIGKGDTLVVVRTDS